MAFLIASPLCEFCWFIQHVVYVLIPFILMGKSNIFYPKLEVDVYVYMNNKSTTERVCFLVALACFAESKSLIFELLNSQV